MIKLITQAWASRMCGIGKVMRLSNKYPLHLTNNLYENNSFTVVFTDPMWKPANPIDFINSYVESCIYQGKIDYTYIPETYTVIGVIDTTNIIGL